MIIRSSIVAALSLATLGCSGWKSSDERWVVLKIVFDGTPAADALVHGTGEPSIGGPFPDHRGLAQALHQCGQPSFELIDALVTEHQAELLAAEGMS